MREQSTRRAQEIQQENAKHTSKASSTAQPTDLSSVQFNQNAPELTRTWHSYAPAAFCLNTYPNGITFSAHTAPKINRAEEKSDSDKNTQPWHPSQFHLRVKDTKNYLLPAGKYFLYKENYIQSVERRLITLKEQGLLSSSVIYFGVTSDPFASFHKKFDITMNCLQLLETYRPRRVVIQTRSPMVISALPTLKALGDRAVVAMPIETRLERAVQRYTPGQPKISERLVAAAGLRRQGVKVNLVASPILPYGDIYRDAWDFADMLDKHSDYITFGCLAYGKPSQESSLKALPVARKLVADKKFRWLRPHAYRHLYFALQVLAPEKLLLPVKPEEGSSQLSLFAA